MELMLLHIRDTALYPASIFAFSYELGSQPSVSNLIPRPRVPKFFLMESQIWAGEVVWNQLSPPQKPKL